MRQRLERGGDSDGGCGCGWRQWPWLSRLWDGWWSCASAPRLPCGSLAAPRGSRAPVPGGAQAGGGGCARGWGSGPTCLRPHAADAQDPEPGPLSPLLSGTGWVPLVHVPSAACGPGTFGPRVLSAPGGLKSTLEIQIKFLGRRASWLPTQTLGFPTCKRGVWHSSQAWIKLLHSTRTFRPL